MTKKSALEQAQKSVQVLKKNVLDQVPYTTQALEYLKSLPVTAYLPTSGDRSAGYYIPNNPAIHVRTDTLLDPRQPYDGNVPATVYMHEAGHALDANLNYPYEASPTRQGKNSGDSYGFFNLLKNNPHAFNFIGQFLQSYYPNTDKVSMIPNQNPQMSDVEAFAEQSAQGAKNFLQNPGMLSVFGSMYKPMSKNINYSPVYPTVDFLNYQSSPF